MVTITQTIVTSQPIALCWSIQTQSHFFLYLLCMLSLNVLPDPCLVIWLQLELAKLSSGSAQFKKKNNSLTYLAPLPKGTPQFPFGQDGQG